MRILVAQLKKGKLGSTYNEEKGKAYGISRKKQLQNP